MDTAQSECHSACDNTRRSRRRIDRVARRTLATLLVLAATVVPAFAVSLADIVQLAKAGLSDDVLVSLIQTDNTVFPLDAERILELRAAGVSERVIIALLQNGRRRPEGTPPTDAAYVSPNATSAAPTYVAPDLSSATPAYGAPNFGAAAPFIPYEDPATSPVPYALAPPVVIQVQTPQPAFVAHVYYVPHPIVAARRGPRHHRGAINDYRGFGRFINDGWVERNRGFGRFINDGWVERGGARRSP